MLYEVITRLAPVGPHLGHAGGARLPWPDLGRGAAAPLGRGEAGDKEGGHDHGEPDAGHMVS